MRAFALIEMVDGLPNIGTTPIGGYCLGAVQGIWGLYLVAGTAAQLTTLQALPNVYRVCTAAELDTVITAARRTKMNEWLTAQGWPNIPVGWTYGQCVRWAYKRANPDWDEAKHYLADIA